MQQEDPKTGETQMVHIDGDYLGRPDPKIASEFDNISQLLWNIGKAAQHHDFPL